MADTRFLICRTVYSWAVPVATPAALYRMKRSTVRAKDRQDAVALRERFHLEDEP